MIKGETAGYCLNLCETRIDSFSSAAVGKYDEIMIGSYTCGNYFIYLIGKFSEVIFSLKNTEKIILVIPVLAEHQMQKVKMLLNAQPVFGINKIVINDFGGLSLYNEYFSSCVLGLGRIWFREYRDFRYEDYLKLPHTIKMIPAIDLIGRMCCSPVSFEIECIGEHLDLSLIPDKYKVYLHYPEILSTYGHICEFASVNKDLTEKFRPDSSCQTECFGFLINYDKNNTAYFKKGRGVYYTISKERPVRITGHDFFVICNRQGVSE